MTRRRRSRPASRSRIRRMLGAVLWFSLGLLLVLGAIGVWYVQQLDQEIQARFEGKRWALPARVFARPLELYAGRPLTPELLRLELEALHYREDGSGPGSFAVNGGTVTLTTRPFVFSDGREPARSVRLRIGDGRIGEVRDRQSGGTVDLMRVEPMLIGSIFPTHGEDRVLVTLDEVPPGLVAALLATEDRRFLSHRGVDPIGIARAAWANLRAGRTVQGGSTLTQQLVKNFYLTHDQTLRRKGVEAVMAVLLEYRYSKEEILEAYLNEVFLGQSGARAIHGFGLAAEFYFQRPLRELELDQLALLVGLARGASYYDPRRFPERALARRNGVLDRMQRERLAPPAQVQEARARPLGVSPQVPRGDSRFPAFVDLVRRQLRDEYREEDLRSEGLRIFTTLDPGAQLTLERQIVEGLEQVTANRDISEPLQVAAVLTDPLAGEVLALVGDRDPRFPGFNRAVDAKRPIGSLVKPFVYLAALSDPEHYSLATLLDDSPLTLQMPHGEPWSPQNFNRRFHGQVTAWEALVQSYNVASVRLGLQIGIPQVVRLLQTLGLERDPAPLPSLALGALDLSPLEVATLYQALANGGYATRSRAIRDVLDAGNQELSHYSLELRGAVPDGAVQVVNHALHDVTTRGTGQRIGQRLPGRVLAGKTGSSSDLRDSWFAGFDDRHLLVVWVGLDDNRPTGLTGATGAVPLWIRSMAALPGGSLSLGHHPEIRLQEVDRRSGLRTETEACPDRVRLPFWRDSAPRTRASCDLQSGSYNDGASGWRQR
ncbi:penicillin-binding protein 1B [Thioalkalivibrio paradoxus]|uniref:Penicillin-binding protein 1B n=1 Tax=Thioalkalivibrio paradoxus ARh 1 TaxID=713585 RepID=W0DJW2_9GAMM|nr:penicillin-binding protein 1B [Thioalkalivibrio paradoxus]AHE98904.1 penicillin-binding protein 1B [Thioalkalivibrio paradoxus ARh 1]